MSISQELYNRLSETIPPLVRVSNSKQVTNWLWIVVGLVLGNSPALSKIATYLPMATQAESRVMLIRRWLKNLKVDVWAFYEPILAHVLQGWRAVEVFVILDGVMVFGDRWQVFRVSLQHGCRAIPLIWMVVDGKGVIAVERLAERLGRVAQFLRRRVHRVTFLADRGFRDCDWAKLARKLGWHYDLRITCNTYITLEDGRTSRVDELGVPRGQHRYFQNVRVTKDGLWRANLSVGWTAGDAKTEPELLVVMSDQTACRARLREYGRRMSIEQSFRDDQSGGFDLEHTRLQHADRLERLLLALAVATLWCHELGERVLAHGDTSRRQIDPGPTRELSLFQLGLRWLKRCVAVAIHDLPIFRARLSNLKLAPVVRVAV